MPPVSNARCLIGSPAAIKKPPLSEEDGGGFFGLRAALTSRGCALAPDRHQGGTAGQRHEGTDPADGQLGRVQPGSSQLCGPVSSGRNRLRSKNSDSLLHGERGPAGKSAVPEQRHLVLTCSQGCRNPHGN